MLCQQPLGIIRQQRGGGSAERRLVRLDLTGRCSRNLILLQTTDGQEEISEGDLNNLEPRQVHGVLRQSGAKTSRSLHAGQERRRGDQRRPRTPLDLLE